MSLRVGNARSGFVTFTGSSKYAFNPYAQSPTTFFLTGGGTFNLSSFVIAGAWGSQTLLLEGLLGNVVVDTRNLAVTTTPQVDTLNWARIDTLRISVGNGFVNSGWPPPGCADSFADCRH